MSEEELIQEAIKQLKAAGEDVEVDKVNRLVAALRDIQEITGQSKSKKKDKPAADAEASQEPAEEPVEASSDEPDAEEVEASAAPDADAEDPETVEASTEVKAAEPPADAPVGDEESEPAIEGEAVAAVGIIAESSGLSDAEVVAGLRENADAIGAMLKGEPSGMPAEQPMASKDDTALKASKARAEALSAQLKSRDERIAELESKVGDLHVAQLSREVDDAVKAGHILEQHRAVFVALAKSDPDEFRAQMDSAQERPAIPTGRVYQSANDKAPEVQLSQLAGDPQFESLVKALRNAPAPGGKGRMTEKQARIAAAKTYSTEAH